MAEEFVSKDQFEEFTKRMEQGFDQVGERFNQVNRQFDQVNQQFDQVNRRLEQMSADIRAEMRANNANIQAQMNQMRNWLIGLYGIVVFGFIGSIFLTIIKQSTGTP